MDEEGEESVENLEDTKGRPVRLGYYWSNVI